MPTKSSVTDPVFASPRRSWLARGRRIAMQPVADVVLEHRHDQLFAGPCRFAQRGALQRVLNLIDVLAVDQGAVLFE